MKSSIAALYIMISYTLITQCAEALISLVTQCLDSGL